MRRNTVTSLKRRTVSPMAGYDRLPSELRGWLRNAALPWSAPSALRLWNKALAERNCTHHAQACLCAAEARMLARDAPAIWGKSYPLEHRA
ncbi:DUF6525 family protein [Falsirhodobacter sp. alg1]|uniref:DUF6525 family protein n=1 Tax=Falsirhodobacter sp. alg1 TaxID=1472418 RepID=UPI0005F087FD|nr:DUF6525 family protein [Falsirhodobacter sp. alg1]